MTIISFSVFKDQLLDGRKTQTLRPVPANPNSTWNKLWAKWNDPEIPVSEFDTEFTSKGHPWIELQIYWKAQSKYREKLFDAVLTNMTIRTLGSLSEAEWIADGFEPNMIDDIDQGGNHDISAMSARAQGLIYFAKNNSISLYDPMLCQCIEVDTCMGCSNINNPKLLNFQVYQITWRRI